MKLLAKEVDDELAAYLVLTLCVKYMEDEMGIQPPVGERFWEKRHGGMTNQDLLRQLQTLAQIALREYPFPEDADLDTDLILTLGQIAGMATKAVEDYEKRIEPVKN